MPMGFVSIDDFAQEAKERYRVFVYGTLMRGERAHAFLSGARFVGEYCLKDYAMYDLGWYPGICPSPGDAVYGELYEVDGDMLREMDGYEGEGRLYHRTQVTVRNGAEKRSAFVYVYAQEIFGEKIEGGKWNERKR